MKKTEDRRLTIILGVFVALIVLVIGVTISNNLKKAELASAQLDSYQLAMNSSEAKLIYIGRSGCSYCQMLKPIVADFEERYDLEYTYIDTDYLSAAEQAEMLKELGVETSEFGTPYLAFVKDGKKVDEQIGFYGEEEFFNFIKENKAIASDSELLLTYLDYASYQEVLNSDTNKIIVLGQTTCSYCQQVRPIFQEIIEEEGIDIYYYEINMIKEEAENTAVSAFATEALGSNWGTPAVIIVKDGKKVAAMNGANTKEAYIALFKDNGIID